MYVLTFRLALSRSKNEMRGIKFRMDASRGETNEKGRKGETADLREARAP